MNREHMELCGSDGWGDVLRDLILPYALGDVSLGGDVLEVGPGPGRTTDLLRSQVPRLTAVEIDDGMATVLADRLAGTNVEVINADARAIPLPGGRFTGAVCFTMLHHVPTTRGQDSVFAEVARLLAPGAPFVASDSVASPELEALHVGDTYNPVDPATVEARLLDAGFAAAEIRENEFGWAALAHR